MKNAKEALYCMGQMADKCLTSLSAIQKDYKEFVSLVKRMREAQDAFNISISVDNIEDIDFWHIRMLELEREVDEYLEKVEDLKNDK